MKTKLINMRLEITVENGDPIGEALTFRGSPTKIIKHLAKHEWEKLTKHCESSLQEVSS